VQRAMMRAALLDISERESQSIYQVYMGPKNGAFAYTLRHNIFSIRGAHLSPLNEGPEDGTLETMNKKGALAVEIDNRSIHTATNIE
jgi:hypothetical protein